MRLEGDSVASIAASPEVVFAAITDLAGLSSWNTAMTTVCEAPAKLQPGAEWVVEFHALGRRWLSRSRCEAIDPGVRHFSYRSQTDDGNPSCARWQWWVDEAERGAIVRVRWELHPITFWRRVLLGHIRARQLARREVPASLAALSRVMVGPSR